MLKIIDPKKLWIPEKPCVPQLFFFIHHTAATYLYIDGDILSYFRPAGYVLGFDDY